MKTYLLVLFGMFFITLSVNAKDKNSSKNKSVSSKKILSIKSQRTTDANFTGATVHGKYAHSPESTVSVEQEKQLISVVKPREKLIFQVKKSREDYK